MSVSIRPVRVQALREAILVCLAEPRSIAEIARRTGCSARAARRHVEGLSELGVVVPAGRPGQPAGDAVSTSWVRVASVDLAAACVVAGPPPRPAPIRDAILRFLTVPRSAAEVALHIERPVPTATGHLAAMRRLGLVKRVGRSAYAGASYEGPAVDLESRRSLSDRGVRRLLWGLLHQRSSILGLVCKTGAPADIIRAAIHDLWLSGVVSGDEQSGYRLTAAAEVSAQRKSSRAIRKPRP
jgi:predicted transcriptional regulator